MQAEGAFCLEYNFRDFCDVKPTKDSTGAGPYWVNDIGYSYSSFTRDLVQGEEIYHHYCKSKNNQTRDLIFAIQTGGGPIYQYKYGTKEIKSIGRPI